MIQIFKIIVDFVGKFSKVKPHPNCGSDRINILLFGLAGSTKSSFLNSVFTLLNNNQSQILHKAISGANVNYVTVKLERHKLEGTNINLWDCWGLTQKTFKGNELDMILDGRVNNNNNNNI